MEKEREEGEAEGNGIGNGEGGQQKQEQLGKFVRKQAQASHVKAVEQEKGPAEVLKMEGKEEGKKWC